MRSYILKHILFYAVNIVLLNVAIYFFLFKNVKSKPVEPHIIGTLPQKLEYYKLHKNEYKLVFIGDSRTFTNISNYQLDSCLHTNSINMAMWANWFPTQYAFLQDFLPQVPDSTYLVFSMGYQNFNRGDVQDAYPIEYTKAQDYFDWGFSARELRNPMVYQGSKILPLLFLSQPNIHAWMSEEMKGYIAVFPCKEKKETETVTKTAEENKPVEVASNVVATQAQPNATTTAPMQESVELRVNKLVQQYKQMPEVGETYIKKQGDSITSVEIYWNKGNYWRIEIDSLFFRRKQAANAPAVTTAEQRKKLPDYKPEDKYWKNFVAITKLLKTHSKRLHIIFNKIDEAPYTYQSSGHEIFANFLNKQLVTEVKSQGFTFITIDVKDIPDSDYFDYNHMNNKGSLKYTERLCGVLKPYMR